MKEGGAQSGESGSLFSALPQLKCLKTLTIPRREPKPGAALWISRVLSLVRGHLCSPRVDVFACQGLKHLSFQFLHQDSGHLTKVKAAQENLLSFPDTFPLHVRLFKNKSFFIWLCQALVAACRIFSCGMQTLSCSVWDPGTLTRDGTQAPCIGSVAP